MTDRDRAARHITARATAIRDAELERAHDRLDDLTPRQRAIVDDLADDIVTRLIATPQQALADADQRTLDAALALFGTTDVTRT